MPDTLSSHISVFNSGLLRKAFQGLVKLCPLPSYSLHKTCTGLHIVYFSVPSCWFSGGTTSKTNKVWFCCWVDLGSYSFNYPPSPCYFLSVVLEPRKDFVVGSLRYYWGVFSYQTYFSSLSLYLSIVFPRALGPHTGMPRNVTLFLSSNLTSHIQESCLCYFWSENMTLSLLNTQAAKGLFITKGWIEISNYFKAVWVFHFSQ